MPRSYQVTASDPRAAADDTTDVGQTNWSTATLRVSPPPTRDLTGQAGHHRPTTRTVTLTADPIGRRSRARAGGLRLLAGHWAGASRSGRCAGTGGSRTARRGR